QRGQVLQHGGPAVELDHRPHPPSRLPGSPPTPWAGSAIVPLFGPSHVDTGRPRSASADEHARSCRAGQVSAAATVPPPVTRSYLSAGLSECGREYGQIHSNPSMLGTPGTWRSRMVHTPAYRRIVNDITARLDSGVLRYGDRLPSGRQLQRQYCVSAQPVKTALFILEDRGYSE